MDIGPKSYRRYKNGRHLVIRFFVEEERVKYRGAYRRTGRYFVYDMEAIGRIAGMTSKSGYPNKKEAVKIAREYRDRYGAYTRFKF